MNRMIPKIGAGVVTAAVFLFAVCLLMDFSFGAYLVCMFLPVGYIMTAAGFYCESDGEHRVAACVGIVFSAIYAVLVFLVYFAQTTSVRLDDMTEQAVMILDFKRGGLLFSYDLLGYGMLALSTFFIGLSINIKRRLDKWLKLLLMIHGVFFFGCFIMPMTGIFSSMSNGDTNLGGTAALLFWCIYFLPVGVLPISTSAAGRTTRSRQLSVEDNCLLRCFKHAFSNARAELGGSAPLEADAAVVGGGVVGESEGVPQGGHGAGLGGHGARAAPGGVYGQIVPAGVPAHDDDPVVPGG